MKLISVLTALLTLVVSASALPHKSKPNRINGAQPANATQLATDPCAAVNALADGIAANIKIQQQELIDAAAVGAIINATDPVDAAQFAAAQTKLLATVNQGVKIRENNQKIAPAGNPAIAGLQVVAEAQAQEKAQVEGLTGTKADVATIATLTTEFNGGIAKNQENQVAALSGLSAECLACSG